MNSDVLLSHQIQARPYSSPPSRARIPEEGCVMKGMIFALCVLACLLVGSGCMTGGYTTVDRAVASGTDTLALTPHDIIAMSRAKIGDGVIIKMIRSSGAYFQLRSRDVVALADSGVSDKVIEAMLSTAERHDDRGAGSYYAPYYPAYWWGAYPYYYPWSFGFSLGYYAPFYHGGYVGSHYGYGVPRYHYTSHSPGVHSGGGHTYGAGRSTGMSRPSGRRR